MRAHGYLHRLVGGAPTRLVNRDRDRGFQRQGRLRNVADGAGRGGHALRIRIGHGDIHIHIREGIVHAAELVFGEGRKRIAVRGELGGAFAGETGCGRAVEKAAFRFHMEVFICAQHFLLRGQRHLQPLRHEIGDIELHAADGGAFGIDEGRDLPAAMRRGIAQRHVPHRGAGGERLAGHGGARELHAVGTRGDQGERRGDSGADAVAQHRGRMDGFAGAIDAALGIQISVDRTGRVAAADAAIREIEGRTAQIEEAEITVRTIGHHDDGFVAALAVEQTRIKIGAALPVGRYGGEHIVVARHQRELHARERLRRCIRAREDRHPVRALECGDRDVGIDHPLAGHLTGIVIVAVVVGGFGFRRILRHQHIGARRLAFQDVADGDQRNDAVVLDVRHIHRALPHNGALAVFQLGLVIGIERGLIDGAAFDLR